jgi:hypothetical protein
MTMPTKTHTTTVYETVDPDVTGPDEAMEPLAVVRPARLRGNRRYGKFPSGVDDLVLRVLIRFPWGRERCAFCQARRLLSIQVGREESPSTSSPTVAGSQP